jgi:hypothetical protein
MLDTLDLSVSLDKETYKSQIEDLMRQLRTLSTSSWEQQLPVVVVLEGWASAGKGTLLKKNDQLHGSAGFCGASHSQSFPPRGALPLPLALLAKVTRPGKSGDFLSQLVYPPT